MKKYLSVIMVLLLLGCAASGPTFVEYIPKAENSAVVYVYRPTRSVNCCVAPSVYIDTVKHESLKNGGYLAFEITPGMHEITVGDGSYGFAPATIQSNFESGHTYYFKWLIGSIQELNLPAMYAGREYHLVKVEVGHAMSEIIPLKYSAK